MSSVDQFASVFNAAAKTIFQYKPPVLKNTLIITDLESTAADQYVESAKSFFAKTKGPWDVLKKGDFTTVKDLLDIVGNKKPDLIVTYRHLHSEAVAIMPHPDREGAPEHAMKNTANVMAINDHLTGEDCLVNHASHMTLSDGTLHLTHIEDDVVFDRYMEVISKIPEIDTDVARETIRNELLSEPSAYIDSVEEVLSHELPNIKVIKHVSHGQQLEQYRKSIDEHKADLVVVKAHDPDQQAMNATAYSIAVELRTTPLLIV